jgi:hypothetical protein
MSLTKSNLRKIINPKIKVFGRKQKHIFCEWKFDKDLLGPRRQSS